MHPYLASVVEYALKKSFSLFNLCKFIYFRIILLICVSMELTAWTYQMVRARQLESSNRPNVDYLRYICTRCNSQMLSLPSNRPIKTVYVQISPARDRLIIIWATTSETVHSDICAHGRLKLASACAQSNQSTHEETLHSWLSKMCPVKILIRLSECADVVHPHYLQSELIKANHNTIQTVPLYHLIGNGPLQLTLWIISNEWQTV